MSCSEERARCGADGARARAREARIAAYLADSKRWHEQTRVDLAEARAAIERVKARLAAHRAA